MRLPVEDDWKPSVTNKEVTGDEYEKHVWGLAELLREASKVARSQSKLSHETAKRYYDRRTKLEQFNKGTLVYMYDATYRRGRAKKFSYQYKGPYEIEQKISPLIYKVKLADGTSTIVHVNRLKRASGKETDSSRLPARKHNSQAIPLKSNPEYLETFEQNTEVPPYTVVTENVFDNLSEIEDEDTNSLSPSGDDESSWTPQSLYLQRKLQNDKAPYDIAYRLRSRLVSRSVQEPELDKRETENSNKSGNGITQDKEGIASIHSYNLRDLK